MATSSGLLISVRSASEVEDALAGGATLLDVKEPANGPLGRAERSVIEEVVRQVAGRVPVSAAMGELRDVREQDAIYPSGLAYMKWGLARCAKHRLWREQLLALREAIAPAELVFVAYADWQLAQAPSPSEVLEIAQELAPSTMLIDTYGKAPLLPGLPPSTLLDCLPVKFLLNIHDECVRSKVCLALAGRVGLAEIDALAAVRPDWFAVRGAACGDGDRAGSIVRDKVRELRERIG